MPVSDAPYLASTMASIPSMEQLCRSAVRTPYGEGVVVQAQTGKANARKKKLADATHKAKDFKRPVVTNVPGRSLVFERHPDTGRVTGARVDIVASSQPGQPPMAATSETLKRGAKPPYIKMAVAPTIEETVDLFTLSPDQAAPAALLAQLLLDERAGLTKAQCRVVMSGMPGSGKSQVGAHVY